MEKKLITIVISSDIETYLFKPIIVRLVERNVRIIIYCLSVNKELVNRELVVSPSVSVEDLDKIKRHHKNRRRIHRGLRALFTRNDFSFMYQNKKNDLIRENSGVRSLLLKISNFMPKVPNNKINFFLQKATGVFLRNPFPTNKILVGSLNGIPELLCAKGQEVYTIMESWDHLFKKPNGYVSERVYTWNQSLSDDWKAFQYDNHCIPLYPLKLRFAIQEILEKELWKKSRGNRHRPMCVYAVNSTKRSTNMLWRSLDELIITDLIMATYKAKWDLFIKPRPQGEKGEFDHFLKGNSHVEIGCYLDVFGRDFANYFLDDNYNMRRFQEIIEADLVINAFTTFGLDAAVAGIPVLQLDLRDAIGYEDSSRVFGNQHVQKYLLGQPYAFKISGAGFLNQITNYLRAPTGIAEHFSEYLRNWLIPEYTMDVAIEKLLDDLGTQG